MPNTSISILFNEFEIKCKKWSIESYYWEFQISKLNSLRKEKKAVWEVMEYHCGDTDTNHCASDDENIDTSKTHTSKTHTSKTHTSKAHTSKTHTSKTHTSKTNTSDISDTTYMRNTLDTSIATRSSLERSSQKFHHLRFLTNFPPRFLKKLLAECLVKNQLELENEIIVLKEIQDQVLCIIKEMDSFLRRSCCHQKTSKSSTNTSNNNTMSSTAHSITSNNTSIKGIDLSFDDMLDYIHHQIVMYKSSYYKKKIFTRDFIKIMESSSCNRDQGTSQSTVVGNDDGSTRDIDGVLDRDIDGVLDRDIDGVLDEIESKLKSADFDCIDFKQQQHVKELVQLLDQLGL